MSREYGWDDDTILDLPIRRLRQIVAAINRRNLLNRREQISLISWQTRQISSYIAAGYMTDGKHGNPALDAASSLAFDKIDEALVTENQQRHSETSSNSFDEEGNIVAKFPEPQPASFERFLGSMGNPARWSGR